MLLHRDPDGLAIGLYEPEDDAEALQLERSAAQGQAYRLTFRRPTFRRRAENFERHVIVTARLEQRLVGIGAMAMKDVWLHGQPLKAAFHFDYRVQPELRGRHIARRVSEALVRLAEGAVFHYSYAISDNLPALRAAAARRLEPVASYAYLVYPCFRTRKVQVHPSQVTLAEAHAELLRTLPPFDFYTDPTRGGSTAGHVASWLLRRGRDVAGCSVWDNTAILAEAVEALPWQLRVLGQAFALAPSHWPLPHIPAIGEQLRSLYVFDFFATDPALARELLGHVNNVARTRGVDYCYVIHLASDPWLGALRHGLPKAIAPIVPYRLLAACKRPLPQIVRPYVDVRDL